VAEPQLELPEVCIEVEERVGEGAFATVFKVDIIECSFIDLEGGETNAALKVLNEPSLWEWYIHHQILERIPRNLVPPWPPPSAGLAPPHDGHPWRVLSFSLSCGSTTILFDSTRSTCTATRPSHSCSSAMAPCRTP
jgi:hypothetical protein